MPKKKTKPLLPLEFEGDKNADWIKRVIDIKVQRAKNKKKKKNKSKEK